MMPPPTDRQWQIWQLLGEGLDHAAIADRLGIAGSTLHGHLYGVKIAGGGRHPGLHRRIGARSRLHAAVLWQTRGVHQCPLGHWWTPRE